MPRIGKTPDCRLSSRIAAKPLFRREEEGQRSGVSFRQSRKRTECSLLRRRGPLVKWLRQRPLTPLTSVRIRYGSPNLFLTDEAKSPIM